MNDFGFMKKEKSGNLEGVSYGREETVYRVFR